MGGEDLWRFAVDSIKETASNVAPQINKSDKKSLIKAITPIIQPQKNLMIYKQSVMTYKEREYIRK